MWKPISNLPPRSLFLILLVLKISRCLPIEDLINPAGLASLEWGLHLQGFENLSLPENVSYSHFRGKRFINLGSVEQTPNKPYQACIAPGNKMGHCRHLNRCVLEDFRSNFVRYLDYMCIIERTYVGTCCPDRAKVVKMDSLNAESLAGALPAVASDSNDQPIWSPVEESHENNLRSTESDIASLENSQNSFTTISKEDPIRDVTRAPRGPRGCGMSTRSRTRIVGGRPADPKEWPWMVALLRQNAVHYCGGVLITDRHVLTAAHCVYQYKTHEIRVRLGEYDFSRPDETRSIDFKVVEIRHHLEFDPTTYVHDIAIVKIHRPTVFNSYIWPICLPPIGQSFENKSAIVTGWGTQYFGGPASSILMEVAIPVWPQAKCVRSFTQNIPNTAMCAGAYEGGRDSCQGDSGGPLLHQLGNGRWVNIGIVSWGIRCGEPGRPGIYTRVNAYLDWIFSNAVF